MTLLSRNFILFVLLVPAVQVLFAGPLLPVEDVIVLPKTGHRKPPIVFTHRLHSEVYGTKCVDCHHTGQNVRCSNCHMRRDRDNVINLKGAYHQQCLDCHRKTAGPKGCGRCHRSSAP